MNKRLPYTQAEIEIIDIEASDVIATSGDSFDFGDGGSNSDPNGW